MVKFVNTSDGHHGHDVIHMHAPHLNAHNNHDFLIFVVNFKMCILPIFSISSQYYVLLIRWLELINTMYCLLKVFIIHSSLLLNYYFQVHLNGSSCSRVLWEISIKTRFVVTPFDLNLSILLIKDLYNPFVIVTELLFQVHLNGSSCSRSLRIFRQN